MTIHARVATERLLRLARQFPAVAILGPRQIGKSTLARLAFGEHHVLDLENPLDFDRVRTDAWFAVSSQRRLVIDEAQRMPELFPLLRSHLDRSPAHRVVLLGSASPTLVRSISESLAGRVGFFDMGGVSVLEEAIDAVWMKGGFPRVHWGRPRPKPAEWYPAYLRACLEQDVPQLGFRLSSTRLRTLITMVASAQGGLCNASEIGASLGVSYHTVSHLLDVLEGVFLLRRLRPFATNVRKRLVKAPKVYVRDTGLLHALLGVGPAKQQLLRHPKAGASFETLCVDQLISHAQLADPGGEAFFYRTHGGVEVDLILSHRGKLLPIEIKLGLTPPDTRSLQMCMADLGARRGYVVNAGSGETEIRSGVVMCGLRDMVDRLVGRGAGC